MSATIFSLISVTVGFAALVIWVYSPSRRDRIEALAQIPLESDEDAVEQAQERTEKFL